MRLVKHVAFMLIALINFLIPGHSQENRWQASESLVNIDISNYTSFQKYKPLLFIADEKDTIEIYIIVMDEGNEFIGKIIEETPTFYRLKTDVYGIIELLKINIKSINALKIEQVRNGVYWKDHIQSSRYFWQPNGYGLKKGEAYYQNVWVFFNQFGLGLSDNVFLGAGILPLFLLGGGPTPIWITPKLSFPLKKEKVNFGVGGLFATIVGQEGANLGIVYGSVTFGERNRNLTIGTGWGYGDGSWLNSPIFSVSFLSRVRKKGYFLMENYIIDIDNTYGILSLIGGRSIVGKSVGLDYGLVIPIFADLDTFFAIPWLGITIPLKKNN